MHRPATRAGADTDRSDRFPRIGRVPEGVSAKKRARDIDRAQACALLDAGYGEGQLGPSEYHTRTTQAMKAKTLAELASLVSDLQIPEHLVEAARSSAPKTRRLPVHRRGVAAVAVAIVAIFATVIYTTRDDDTATEAVAAAEQAPAPAPTPEGEPEAKVIEHLDPVSPEGIREFVRRLAVKFERNLRVDQVTFYPEYVYFTRMLDGQPHREQDWSFRDGFSPSGQPDSRPLDTATVDLAELDVDRLADVIATGPRLVGMPDGLVSYIFARPDPSTHEPLVTVLFGDSEERSGMVNTRMDGSIITISPVEGR